MAPGNEVVLSSLLGAPVVRGAGPIGALADVGASSAVPGPVVSGILVRRRGDGGLRWVASREIERLDPRAVVLAHGAALGPIPPCILLRRDVLDAQLVDVEGRRVVRVGDVDLRIAGHAVHVDGVEVGLDAVLRRLAPAGPAGAAPCDRLARPPAANASGCGAHAGLGAPSAGAPERRRA